MATPEDLARLKNEAAKAGLHPVGGVVEGHPAWVNRTIKDANIPVFERQRPGSRSDGGMLPAGAPVQQDSMQDIAQRILKREAYWENQLADARALVDNFEDEQIRLESRIAELEAKLGAERERTSWLETRCEELKNVLRAAAEIMVNGEKSKT